MYDIMEERPAQKKEEKEKKRKESKIQHFMQLVPLFQA